MREQIKLHVEIVAFMYAPNRIAHYVCALVAVLWCIGPCSVQLPTHTLAQGARASVYTSADITLEWHNCQAGRP